MFRALQRKHLFKPSVTRASKLCDSRCQDDSSRGAPFVWRPSFMLTLIGAMERSKCFGPPAPRFDQNASKDQVHD
eukprot:2765072-Amphidinium_carterae.2